MSLNPQSHRGTVSVSKKNYCTTIHLHVSNIFFASALGKAKIIQETRDVVRQQESKIRSLETEILTMRQRRQWGDRSPNTPSGVSSETISEESLKSGEISSSLSESISDLSK
jgi:hypothetical protein